MNRASPGRRVYMVAATALMVSASTLIGPSASAYVPLNCKFAGHNPNITYNYGSMLQIFKDAFGGAQSNWDATSVPGVFTYAPADLDPMINVKGASYVWGDWAQTGGYCSSGLWVSEEVDSSFNQRTMGSLTAAQKKIVATHELGHAYGLADNPVQSCSASTKAVMQQGSVKFGCGSTPPWSDDQNGVFHVYA